MGGTSKRETLKSETILGRRHVRGRPFIKERDRGVEEETHRQLKNHVNVNSRWQKTL